MLVKIIVLRLNSIKTITGVTAANGTKSVEIISPLNYLSNFWRTFEMPLTNCEINLILTWYANCVISKAPVNQDTTFAITDTKVYVSVVTLCSKRI